MTTRPPKLTVIKHVVNDNGGTAVAAELLVPGERRRGAGPSERRDGQNELTVPAGTYTVRVRAVPATARVRRCARRVSSTVTRSPSVRKRHLHDHQRRLPATLIVKKVVVNDNGGTKRPQRLLVPGERRPGAGLRGRRPERPEVAAGTYDVTEPAVAGYTTTYQGCADNRAAARRHGDLHVTNNDVPRGQGSIDVQKSAEPDDGQGAGRPGDVLGDDHEHVGRRRRRHPRTSSTTSSATSTTTAATAASTCRSTSPRARR